MKNCKKIISLLLVVMIVFTSNGMTTMAENVDLSSLIDKSKTVESSEVSDSGDKVSEVTQNYESEADDETKEETDSKKETDEQAIKNDNELKSEDVQYFASEEDIENSFVIAANQSIMVNPMKTAYIGIETENAKIGYVIYKYNDGVDNPSEAGTKTVRSWGIGDSVPTISGREVAIITAYSGDVECKSTSKEAFNVMSSASGLVNQNIASEETYIIKNNSNAGIDLKLDVNAVYDYAKYNEKYAVTDFGYSKISLSQYINKSATIAVTNKNEEAVTVYYLSDNASLVSVQKSESPALIKVELESGKSWYFENTGDKGTSIQTEYTKSGGLEYAVYTKEDKIYEFNYNATFASYLGIGYKEVITNNGENTVNFYLPGFFGFIENHETEEKALIKVELESGKSWYFENTGDKGTRIITQHDVKWPYYLNLNWGAYVKYDDNNKVVDFRYSSCETAYLDAGYKEVITNNSEETVNFYLPGFYTFIESRESDQPALYTFTLEQAQTLTINNTYLQELQFGSYSEAVINLTCEVTDKTGKVSKYEQQANAKYMQKGNDVKQKITSRGDSVVYIYTPYLIYKYATNMPDFEILDSVVYNDGKDNIDLINSEKRLANTSFDTFSVKCTANSKIFVDRYELRQDGNVISTNANGEFNNLKVSQFNANEYVYIRTYYADGQYNDNRIHLSIINVTNNPINNLSILSNCSIGVPDDVPIVGGKEISLYELKLPFDSSIEDDLKTYTISLTGGDLADAGDMSSDIPEVKEKIRKYKQKVQELSGMDIGSRNVSSAYRYLKDNFKFPKLPKNESSFSIEPEMEVVGYIDFKISDTGEYIISDVQVVLTMSLSGEGSYAFAIAFVPMSIKYGFSASAGLTLTVDWSNCNTEVLLDTALEGMLGIQAGVDNVAYAGLKGILAWNLTLNVGDNGKIKNNNIEGKIIAYVGVLGYDYDKDIFTGTYTMKEDYETINKWSHESIFNSMDGIYNLDNYHLSESEQAEWLQTDESGKTNTYNIIENKSANAAAPVMISSKDATVMVYIDKNTSRESQNAMQLMYSVYKDGTWSEGKAVDNNSTADFSHMLYVYNDEIYVVYQDAEQEFASTDTINDCTTKLGISVARYDKDADKFTDITRISSDKNNIYESLPVLGEVDGKLTAVWNSNKQADYFKCNETNNIEYSQLVDGKWTKPKTVISNENCITYIQIYNGKIVYVTDDDNNLTTTDDKSMYIVGDDSVKSKLAAGYITNLKAYNIGGTDVFTYMCNGSIYIIDSDSSLAEIAVNGTSYAIEDYYVCDDIIYFIQNNNGKAQLFSAKKKSGNWYSPQCIMSEDGYYYNLSVSGSDENPIAVVLKSTIKDAEKGYDVNNSIGYIKLGEKYDIALNDLTYDSSKIKSGEENEFKLMIANNGSEYVDNVFVSVSDDDGNEIYSEMITVNLNPGQSEEYVVKFNLPDTLSDKYNLKIYTKTDGENIDFDATDDNTKVINCRESKLEIKTSITKHQKGDVITFTVINNGSTSSDAQINMYNENDELVYTYKMYDVSPAEKRNTELTVDSSLFGKAKEGEAEKFLIKVDSENNTSVNNYCYELLYNDIYREFKFISDDIKLSVNSSIKLEYTSGWNENIRWLSSDDSVVTVDENGVLKALRTGNAVITAYSGTQKATCLVTVTVKELDRTLKVGDTGSDVKEVQQYLKNLGYLDSVVDGSYGNATKAAAIIFQSNEGLYVDGEIGNASYKVMQQTGKKFSALKKGMNGNAVKVMQTYLIKLGYLSGTADGAFGSVTTNAVKRFQSVNGLYADGEAGLKTLTVLYGASPKQNVKTLDRTLKVGSTGADVKEVQQYLKNLGYLDSVVDGSYGNATKAAAIIFQSNERLYVDGEIGNASYKVMQQTGKKFSSLKKGMNGNAVKVMQTYLMKLGYLSGVADGAFGTVTENAVKRFQSMNGLYADGEAGLKTLTVLYGASPKQNVKVLGRTLKVGDTGSDVKEVQQYLKNLGYLDSVVDGSYGNATKAAAKIFQANESLYVDGEIGNASYKIMQQTNNKFSALKKGMNGNAVKVMQTYLIKLGYLGGTADGSLGSVTEAAIVRFQKDNGLYADGEAGLKTLSKLYLK